MIICDRLRNWVKRGDFFKGIKVFPRQIGAYVSLINEILSRCQIVLNGKFIEISTCRDFKSGDVYYCNSPNYYSFCLFYLCPVNGSASPPSPTPPLQQEILIIKEYVWDYSFDNLARDCIQDASTKHLIKLGSGEFFNRISYWQPHLITSRTGCIPCFKLDNIIQYMCPTFA